MTDLQDEIFWECPIADGLHMRMKMLGEPQEIKSKIQNIKIIETVPFGRTLILDNFLQSSENDEHIYHETITHPAMLIHPNPETVFIGGAGEMGIAREVLKYRSVKKVIMVDIDEAIINLAKTTLKEKWDLTWVLEDKRLEVVISDAKKYIDEYEGEKFDIVIMDIVDPLATDLGIELYYKEFYDKIKTKMNAGGILVTQSGCAGPLTHRESFTTIHNTLKQSFTNVVPYTVYIPCFADLWGILMAWNDRDYAFWGLDKKINERLKKGKKLRYIDEETIMGQINTPKYLREGCKNESRTYGKHMKS